MQDILSWINIRRGCILSFFNDYSKNIGNKVTIKQHIRWEQRDFVPPPPPKKGCQHHHKASLSFIPSRNLMADIPFSFPKHDILLIKICSYQTEPWGGVTETYFLVVKLQCVVWRWLFGRSHVAQRKFNVISWQTIVALA